MTEQNAFQILKCHTKADVQDAFEDALFGFKSKFLQHIPPLKIIDSNVVKIQKLNSAYRFFYPETQVVEFKSLTLNLTDSLVDFLTDYQFSISQIRLQIANANEGEGLINTLTELKLKQQKLYFKLGDICTINELDKFPIKLSQEIDVFAVQSNLKDLGYSDTKISEYIRGQITTDQFETFSDVTLAVINAKKQIEFNGLRREI